MSCLAKPQALGVSVEGSWSWADEEVGTLRTAERDIGVRVGFRQGALEIMVVPSPYVIHSKINTKLYV